MRLPLNLGDRSSLARQLVAATLGSATVRIVGMAMTFLIGVQLSRYLGPGGYGVYGTVMAVVALLLMPAQLGLPQIMTRDIPAAMAERDFTKVKGALIWFTLFVLLASSVLVTLGIVGFRLLCGEQSALPYAAYYWGLAAVPLFALSSLAAGVLRGFHRVVSAQFYDALFRPATFACLIFLIGSQTGGLSPASALALQVISISIALALSIWQILVCMTAEVRNASVVKRPSGWLTSAGPITGTEIIRALDGQYAVLLLGILATIEDVGLFRVALSAAVLFGLPSTLINLVVMPYVAQLNASSDQPRLQLLATSSALAMLAGTLSMTAVIYLFGAPLIAFVFGEAFRSAWPVLVALAIAYSINAFFGSSAIILNMSGQERMVTIAYLCGLATGIALSCVLIGPLGIVGCGVALMGSEFVKGAILWRTAFRRMDIDIAATSVIRLRESLRGSTPHKRRSGII